MSSSSVDEICFTALLITVIICVTVYASIRWKYSGEDD